MRDAARAGLVAVGFLLLASPASYGSTGFAFLTATLQLVAVVVILALYWDRIGQVGVRPGARRWMAAAAVGAVAGFLVVVAARGWLHEILIYPNTADRADMLVLIQLGIRRVLQGRNPYSTYHLPWDATLSYGPMMWAPYLAPQLLHIDLRLLSLLGGLFVPVACAIAAVGGAFHGRLVSAAAWCGLLLTIAVNGDLRHFAPMAHTPVYWPLLALFTWLVARERWTAAAVACGLLVVARTTMVSIAPVLLMVVWGQTPHNRKYFGTVAALLVAASVLPYLPFAIWNWGALRYALVGAYQSVMKGFVWTSTTWAQDTLGLTGLLLRQGWRTLVEPAQVVTMLIVYVFAWRAIRHGRRPLPWMGLALFAFSATTLWPVQYVYFDVLLLFACAALAETPWLDTPRVISAWAATLAVALTVLMAVVRADVPRDTTLDIGSEGDRPFLYSGFADDERGSGSFTWVDGTRAEILIPRRSRRDADLDLVCEPNLPRRDSTQDMSVALNGIVLGTVSLREGWQTVTLPAPARAWQIGANELALSFSNAVSPLEAGISADARKLSVAFDRLTVRTR
ncbi:MAG TPA: hypothetical protein VGY48_21305 [Vicinamibacterales bacterium]|nr:hypothetical protein [Vicinamibacterales bacterium]